VGSHYRYSWVQIPVTQDVLRAVPRLTSLTLQGVWEDLALSGSPFDQLGELGLLATAEEMVAAIGDARLPQLTRLTLWLGDCDDDDPEIVEVDALEPLLEVDLPALRTVALHHCDFGDSLVAALPRASWFERLDELALHHVDLSDHAATALLSSAYGQLRRISVVECSSEDTMERLRADGRGRIATQRDD